MKKQESKKAEIWLGYAKEDLKAAQELLNSRHYFPHIIAYHAQQTVEKCLKAFLIAHNKIYPKTHDLIVLLNLCKDVNRNFKNILGQINLINPLYIEQKYPFEPVDDYGGQELKSFIKAAQAVFNFVKENT